MLAPVVVITATQRTILVVLAGMGTTALLAGLGAVDRGDGVGHQVLQLEGFHKIRVPDHGPVGDLQVAHFAPDGGEALAALLQAFLGAEHGRVFLHGALHLFAQGRRRRAAAGVARLVEAGHDFFAGALVRRGHCGLRIDNLGCADGSGAAEDHKVDQRVGAKAVGAMHRCAARLTHSHQARLDAVRVGGIRVQHFAPVVGGNAAHVVVHGRQNRDRLLGHVHAREDLRGFGNARQALGQHGRVQVVEVQEDVILVLADAAAFTDLQGHAARHHVTGGKVLGGGGITLHEALAFRVDQIAAFAAGTLGDEAARAVDAGRMELHEFHVLQRQARTGHHAAAVAGAGVGRGGGEIGAAIAAGRQNHHLRGEAVNGAVIEVPGDHALAHAVFRHDQVEREILDVEFGVVAQGLAIERVQDGVAGTVRRRAGALHRGAFAVVLHVAAEGALVDAAILGAREGHTIVLQLIHGLGGLTGEILHGVGVAEPVGALHRVVHVPFPAVRRHVLQRGGDAALCCHRVGAGGKHLGDAGRAQALLGHAEGGAQTGTAGADHHHIVGVFDKFIGLGHVDQPPKAILMTANTDPRPTAAQKKMLAIRARNFTPSPWT